MTTSDPIVCYTFFTDGQKRPVFEDSIRQYVIDDDGDVVRGVWFIPPEADVPVMVEAQR